MTESKKNYHKMENNDINETSGQAPEESVAEFTADDNSYSFKLIDSDEKHVRIKTDAKDNCVFHSIVEIPRATDQSKVLVSLEDNAKYPPNNFFLNYNSRLHTTKTFDCSVCDTKFKLKLDLDQHVEKYHNKNIKVLVQNILYHDDAHDNNCIDASTSKHLEDEKSNCTLEWKNYVAKHMKVHNYPSSYKEEYLENLGLVPIPVYESLLQNIEKSPMLCRRCEIKFERKDLYSRHIKFCRKRLYEKINVNDYKFDCIVCEKHFSNALLLENHIKSSRGHWICKFCKVVFNKSDLFSKHMVFRKSHNSCLKVDETCVKRGRGCNKNANNSTLIKKTNATKKKLTLRSHSNNATIKQEPIDADLGNGLTDDSIKQEPIDVDLGNGLTDNNIKQEPIGVDFGNGLTDDNIKQEPIDVDLGNGLTDNIKQEPIDVDLSNGLTDDNIKQEPIDVDLSNGLTDDNIKQEPIDVDLSNGLTDDNIKQEPIDVDLNNGLTDNNVKQESIDLDLGHGLTAENIKQEPINIDLGNGLAADNKRNNTAEFACTTCKLSLSNTHSLALHMATHVKRMYKCKLCQKRYKRIRPWVNHLTNHQQQLNLIMSQDNPASLEFNINRNVLRKFEAHITALTSININHIKLEPQVYASPSVFNGNLTETNNFEGKQFEHLKNFYNTRNVVIKKEPTSEHKCNVCQKQFVNAINLTKHMNIHTVSQMPHKCQLCYRAFKTRGNLTNHMKGLQCPIKNEQLSTRNDENLEILSPFELTVQIPKLFKCIICNRSFTSSKGMKIHLKSHYRYKNNYQHDETANKNDTEKHCNQCEKKFSEINALQAHIKVQHSPVYKCDDCGEQFPTNFHLGIHILNKH